MKIRNYRNHFIKREQIKKQLQANKLLRYHQVTMNTLMLLVLAVMIAVEQAVPISSNNTTPTTGVQMTIPALKVEVQNGVTSVYTDIITLENNSVSI